MLPCCKAWPLVGSVAVVCILTTRGRTASPGYHCSGKDIVQGRGVYCLTVGGIQIDQAVVDAFLKAVTPAAVEAMQLAMQQLEADQDSALVIGVLQSNALDTRRNVQSVNITQSSRKTDS